MLACLVTGDVKLAHVFKVESAGCKHNFFSLKLKVNGNQRVSCSITIFHLVGFCHLFMILAGINYYISGCKILIFYF